MIGKRDILVRKRGQANSNGNEDLDKVSISHRSYDPFSYVMLFTIGTDGWHPKLRFAARKRQRKLTPSMFYSWRTFERTVEFRTALSSGRLFQHYLVDPLCKMEAEGLSYWIQKKQSLRAENYTALRELLGDSGGPNDESEAVQSGRMVILPLTLVGRATCVRRFMTLLRLRTR